MSQDFSTTSSIITKHPQKEEIFSNIPSNGFSVKVGASDETELVIESRPAVQGGDYCLRGTRVTIQGILEAENNGRNIDEIRKGLKKYFGVDRSIKELEQAKNEYQTKMNNFINEYYDWQKNKIMR